MPRTISPNEGLAVMRAPNTIRLVPKHGDPFDETMTLIERHGWTESENYSDDLVEWRVPGSDTVVRWITDGATYAQYFVIESPDREQVADHIQDGIEMLKVDDFAGYLEQFYGTQARMHALYTVAAAAPEQSEDQVVQLFESYLDSADALIRQATLVAISIIAWPEFIGAISRMLDAVDPDVQRCAAATLRAVQRITAER